MFRPVLLRRSAILLVLALGVLAIAGPASASTVLLFRTPTGNIGCAYSIGLDGFAAPTVRCDIRSRLRPEPRPPANCRLDSGDSIQIFRLGPATLVCHGDTAIDPSAPILAYGHTWRRSGLTCVSQRIGLRCFNRSGHGFFLSRQSWQIF
jgi:hypothetical protein